LDPTGAPLGGQFRADTSTNIVSNPKVASNASGAFIVVWNENPGDGYANGVLGRRFGADGAPLGGEFLVNESTTGSQLQQSGAMDSSGNFVVIWNDQYRRLLMGRRFSSTGAPLTSEFRVDRGTFGGEFPSVSSDSSGKFVVTWTDLDGIGNLGV